MDASVNVEQDEEALSLLNELALRETDLKQKMQTERQKIDMQAKSLVL